MNFHNFKFKLKSNSKGKFLHFPEFLNHDFLLLVLNLLLTQNCTIYRRNVHILWYLLFLYDVCYFSVCILFSIDLNRVNFKNILLPVKILKSVLLCIWKVLEYKNNYLKSYLLINYFSLILFNIHFIFSKYMLFRMCCILFMIMM